MESNNGECFMTREYYTVEQISEMLNIHPKTIRRYIREGRLHATKIGKSWRITGHDLSVFVESDGDKGLGSSNSAFWFPEIMALSNDYRVCAVDIIGEAGSSEEYRPDIDSDAFALWMKDVLNALSIERAVLIGNSATEIAIVNSEEICISDVQTALDFMISVNYETGSHSIVINKEAVIEDFFVLSTRA